MTLNTGVQNYKRAGIMDTESAQWVYECLGCGALVSNRNQHDIFHSKTRSIIN